MMSIDAFVRDYITRWEDGGSTNPDKTHSLDPLDNGNWTGGRQGAGSLVGSNHGVTAITLASNRGVPVRQITREVMRSLTIAEAAHIAIDAYYIANRLSLLPWDAVIASVLDFGWGAGPIRAVQKLQRLIGVGDDGYIGGATIGGYGRWRSNRTLEQAADTWANVRIAYYEAIIEANPPQAKYRNGWRNRTLYFTPEHREGWWNRFGS